MLQQPLDWQYLLQVTEKHRVLPSVYRHLPMPASSQIPSDIQQELRRRFYKNAQRNLRLTQELMQLLKMFDAQSIPVIPYKGTVLAALAYGKLSLRQVWDIDVLVKKQDASKAKEQLLAAGFRLTESFDREESFFHDERDVEIDLHWGLTPFYFPVDLTFEQLWQNRQPVALNHDSVMSFSNEDLLLILCVQIAKDCWERRQHIEHLAKVCDIAALIHTSPQINWDAVMAHASRAGIERIVYFGLYLAHSLIGAALPASIRAKLQSNKAIIRPVRQACEHLFGSFDDDFVEANDSYLDIRLRAKQLRFYFGLRERSRDKTKHVSEILKTIPAALAQSV
ncbi:MAG: nucleotidyltransferase family protein [Phormidesmis sp.]